MKNKKTLHEKVKRFDLELISIVVNIGVSMATTLFVLNCFGLLK